MNLAQLISGAKWTPPPVKGVFKQCHFSQAQKEPSQPRAKFPTGPYSKLFPTYRLSAEQYMLEVLLPFFSFTEWRHMPPGAKERPKTTVRHYVNTLIKHGYLTRRRGSHASGGMAYLYLRLK